MANQNQLLRRLPSVEAVLSQTDVEPLVQRYPRPIILGGIRRVLQTRRRELLASGAKDLGTGGKLEVSAEEVEVAIREWLSPALTPVINATGVVIHTNLGRAPLSREAARFVAEIAAGYSDLELDLESGKRGSRTDVVREILCELTGAEDALVVNNNAAAVYLILRSLAAGREVLVSRGELVEIGGSFRIPDVMSASGARLVEVGTTNKTRIDDYRRVVGPDTGLLLKIHQSNFAQVGFTEETGLLELAGLARECGIPLAMDMGSGTFLQEVPGILGEVPTVRGILQDKADLVCFSGDKMLGGPQAGIILGKSRWIQVLARDPMARALRVCKLTLASLWTTLSCYRGGDQAARRVPVVDMFFSGPEALSQKAQELHQGIEQRGLSGGRAEVVPTRGQVGGGAMPLVELPGFGVALMPSDRDTEALAGRLRGGRPAVLARRHQERVILDVRTVLDGQLDTLAEAVSSALK